MPPLSTDRHRHDVPCPSGSWDVHHHIFDLDKFPLSPTRHFTPSPAPLPAFEAFQRKMGIDHACIAHGLSFGTDPNSLKYYMDYFQGTARAYGCINVDEISDDEIRELRSQVGHHSTMLIQGIIGVRIDFHLHRAQHDVEEQIRCLQTYAARLQTSDMGLQIYHPHPEFYARLAPVIRQLPVSLVVDHFGGLKTKTFLDYQGVASSAFDTVHQGGFLEICDLLRDNKMWIKLSAPYRCSEDPTYEDMRPLVRALVEANPDRVLYGSDWPHTLPFHRRPSHMRGTDVETFLDFDDEAWVRKLKGWLSEAEWMKLMVENPRKFTGYSSVD